MKQEYLSVTALTKYLKHKFDADPYLDRVFVTGEISNYRKRQGHQYFAIKDKGAKISVAMFQGAFSKIGFELKEGMKVLIVGRVSIYEASGQYQITAEQIQPDGIGSLYQALDQLKKKLDAEGLFKLPKKRIPFFPRKIAILTSPSGAVIEDIQTTVARRFPIAQLILFPIVVQGKNSVASILEKLDQVEAFGDIDTVIIGRGGGSIEDLWSFNDEAVVRRIANFSLPVISSVGHETDTTLIDFVSDVRAATPTAAAELATPELSVIHDTLNLYRQRLKQTMRSQLATKKKEYEGLASSVLLRQPQRIYEVYIQQLDQIRERLIHQIQKKLEQDKQTLGQVVHQLQLTSPNNRLQQSKQVLEQLKKNLLSAQKNYLQQTRFDLQKTIEQLDLLSPLKILSRGYSIVERDEKLVKQVADLQVDDQVRIQFIDGHARAQIIELEKTDTI